MSRPHSLLNALPWRGFTNDFSSQKVRLQTFQKYLPIPVIMHVCRTADAH